MKKILNTIFLATFLFAAACSDGYDDTRIKKDLDDVGQILDEPVSYTHLTLPTN